MAPVFWSLHHGRPCIEVQIKRTIDGLMLTRRLLADTGAGPVFSTFDLLLGAADCLRCSVAFVRTVQLAGAYRGMFPIHVVPVHIASLGLSANFRAVASNSVPPGFDGIACFRFLNQFTYGNFGQSHQFGLET